jgi:hypothetical protein
MEKRDILGMHVRYGIDNFVTQLLCTLAHASKKSFAQFLQERVFQPLGMKHCSLTKPSDGGANYDQHSHQRTLDQISGSPGASAAYCSAHDLALFAMFHLKDHLRMQRQILQDAALDELHRPVTHLEGPQYAMGWWTNNRAGEPVVFGQGGTNDSFTLVELFPAEDMAVVMLANSWGDDLNMPNAIEEAILAKVLPSIHRQPEATTSPGVARAAPAQLVGTWTGRIATYTGGVPVTITILRSGDVHGHIGDVPDAPLRNVSSGGEHVYGILSGIFRRTMLPFLRTILNWTCSSGAQSWPEPPLLARGPRAIPSCLTGSTWNEPSDSSLSPRKFPAGPQPCETRIDSIPWGSLDCVPLYGPFYHRLLVPYKNGVISDAFITTLVDTVFLDCPYQKLRPHWWNCTYEPWGLVCRSMIPVLFSLFSWFSFQ